MSFAPLLALAALAANPVGPNVISTQPVAFSGRGLALVYERYLPARFSVLGVAGVREGGTGDFSTLTLPSASRPVVDSSGTRPTPGPTGGPYLGLRVGLAYTGVGDKIEHRALGSSLAIDNTLSFGYRFIIFRRVELTPSLGVGTRWDFDPAGRLVPFLRPVVTAGLSVGWMF